MLKRAQAMQEQLVAWRREFHRFPELGFQEQRTSARVAEIVEGLGYQVRRGVGRTGVVADLAGMRGDADGATRQGKVAAIRADMDALPITEANQVPYASEVPGVMHACGHDAHTAMLLGVATLLAQETFPGKVRLLFQPAEEVGDEQGISGAPRMVEDGAMQGVDMVVSLHVDSALAAGDVATEAGPNSAGVDTFYATIHGKGGHGATPHKVIDPVYIAGHVILALHGIVSRRLYPLHPAVLSIGAIHAGDASNVIPDRVDLCGTMRFMEKSTQTTLHQEVERALQLARVMGGDYELKFEIGYPPMYDDAAVVALISEVATELLGAEYVKKPHHEMGSEDFGFFSNLAPGAMFSLGAKIEDDEREHHNPCFDIDERCLPVGTAVLAETVLRYLRG